MLCCRWVILCLPTRWRTPGCWRLWTGWILASHRQRLPLVSLGAAENIVPAMLPCCRGPGRARGRQGPLAAPAGRGALQPQPQPQLQPRPSTAARCSGTTLCCSWSALTICPMADLRQPPPAIPPLPPLPLSRLMLPSRASCLLRPPLSHLSEPGEPPLDLGPTPADRAPIPTDLAPTPADLVPTPTDLAPTPANLVPTPAVLAPPKPPDQAGAGGGGPVTNPV